MCANHRKASACWAGHSSTAPTPVRRSPIQVPTSAQSSRLRDIMGRPRSGRSPADIQTGKNKRLIALGLAIPAGRKIFYRPPQTANVFVDGLKPGTSGHG